MKTLNYLTTLLVLSIQVMVNGQTQDNQVRKIRVDIMGAKSPVVMKYSNSNITLTIEEYNQLLDQANQLKIGAQKLKEEAKLAEQNYFNKQLQASQLSAQISLQKFEENKKTILVYFSQIPPVNKVYSDAVIVNKESERLMKLAKEIREEAAAQLTLQAKIGSMSNAEEKETLALDKQTEVLAIINNYLVGTVEAAEDQVSSDVQSVCHQVVMIDRESNQLTESLFDALTQADNMQTTAQLLREKALKASANEKNVLINEALSLENEYIAKRIEISNLKSTTTYHKFDQNRSLINELVSKVKDNVAIFDYVNQLNQDAERLMKIGKEMREEANAQSAIAAKYGSMTNAEETELLAIGKQHESIQFIEKSNSRMVIASR